MFYSGNLEPSIKLVSVEKADLSLTCTVKFHTYVLGSYSSCDVLG